MNKQMKEYYEALNSSEIEVLKSLLEDDMPEEEKSFCRAVYEHLKKEQKQALREKMKEFYEFCKSSGINGLDSFTSGEMSCEERKFCIAAYEYFLQQKQKEIIDGPFAV